MKAWRPERERPEVERKATPRARAASRGLYRRTRPGRGRAGLAALVLAGLGACSTVPVTGRRQFNLISTAQEVELGEQAYDQAVGDAPLITSGPEYVMVERVMNRLVQAVQARGEDPGYEWEVRLIDDDATVNAFALPGGKMAVYTGILPVAQEETGLAVVMGHEIGHVVASHGAERMTGAVGVQLVLDYASGQSDVVGELGPMAADLLFLRPWGRNQELEADRIGLIYMAQAGYDPRDAVPFWQRMSAGAGDAPSEFFSTHPAGETRIEQIRELLPEAVQIYQEAGPAP